jgi:hypothetical protein
MQIDKTRRHFVQYSSAAAVLALAADLRAAQPTGATIAGPIPVTPGTDESYRGENEQPVAGPGLPPPDLIPYGYIEEEYFVSGTVDGKPYTTSLLVRKPKGPSKFSGVVAVETLHAQGAIPFWGQRDVLMLSGHGWVMVVSQRSALEMFPKKVNAARYASLQIPQAQGAAPANPTASNPQDAISQQIMTQVGALLKSNLSHGPFAGLKVETLVMGGSSQTGMTTLRYIQESHAKARLPDGKPVYDGYLPMEAFPIGPITGGDAAVIHVVGEGDFGLFRALHGGVFTIRADSDTPDDRFREYEFPAASHVPTRGIADPKVIFATLDNVMLPGEHLSQFPSAPFFNAAFVNLINWITKGISPPKAPPIEIANDEIARDEYGNAKGGVRTPYVDLPTVRYTASAPTTDNANMVRRMIGLQEPIPAQKLHSLYPSREDYLERFNQEIDRLVSQHWLRPKDGEKLKAEEAKNPPL